MVKSSPLPSPFTVIVLLPVEVLLKLTLAPFFKINFPNAIVPPTVAIRLPVAPPPRLEPSKINTSFIAAAVLAVPPPPNVVFQLLLVVKEEVVAPPTQ